MKNIVLVAHDNYKENLLDWVKVNKEVLKSHKLLATGYTEMVLKKAELDFKRFKSGATGGDIELANAIINNEVDLLIFFCDWICAKSVDFDPSILFRAAAIANIPIAINSSSADWMLRSALLQEDYEAGKDQLVDRFKLAPPPTLEGPAVEEDTKSVPQDVKDITEEFVAIVEKYQATGYESLLKHLSSLLAAKRDCKADDVIEELREHLDVSDEKRELLQLSMPDRIRLVVDKTIEQNKKMAQDVLDKNVSIEDLMVKAQEIALNTVIEKDLKFALIGGLRAFDKEQNND